jgi:hypothetical protein
MPTPPAARWRPLLPAAALSAAAILEPASSPPLWFCPFLFLTGHPCPFCGLTRATCALVKGRLEEAIGFHALSPLVLAALLVWLAVESGAAFGVWRAPDWTADSRPWKAAFALFAVFGVLRWYGILAFSRL